MEMRDEKIRSKERERLLKKRNFKTDVTLLSKTRFF